MASIRKVLGSFSKGTAGAVSVNFGVSGGIHCDTACVHHPESRAADPTGACYAVRTEKRPDRGQLAAKLQRHENLPPALIVGAALVELRRLVERGKTPPWIRLSTNGSLPQPENATKLFLGQLRAFLTYAKRHRIPVHIPVETHRKAQFYRQHVGNLAVVRESLQRAKDIGTTAGPVAFTAGAGITKGKDIRKRRIAAARDLAKARTEKTGRKCIVCPAVVISFVHRLQPDRIAKAKCGNCTACAQPHADIVYPLH